MIAVYLRWTVLVQGLLGFAGGLPYLLTASTLAAWMTQAGVELGAIGLVSLVSLPYSLKFVWAPLVDRVAFGRLGRRRGWMVVTQLALAVAIALLGLTSPSEAPAATALAALLVAVLSATQDIAIDAYRTDLLVEEERAAGAAMYVFGYRMAMIVSGALALRLADWLRSWTTVYLLMAAAMVPAVAITLLAPAPSEPPPPARLRDAIVEPLAALVRRPGAARLLAFVALYRAGEQVLSTMVTSFLLLHGYSASEVADATKLLGMAASIAGALGGGALVARVGLTRCLFAFGLAQAASAAGYCAVALHDRSLPLLWGAVAVENLCAGLAIAALTAFLMAQCDRRFSATQFALLTSASGVAGRLLAGVSGYLAAALGWPAFFALLAAVGAPALLLLRTLPRDQVAGAGSPSLPTT